MEITGLSLGPLGTNCYIVEKEGQALIIDPGGDADRVEAFLSEGNLRPHALLLTHAHFDHIGGVDELRKAYNIDVYLHENEHEWLENSNLNRSFQLGDAFLVETAAPEHNIAVGPLNIGPFEIDVVHTPGHSPGSVTFIFKEADFIVSGDVLFHQGIGRTDLPEGSMDELAKSILTKLYSLPDHYTVYPGHGIQTTIGSEKIHNPFTKLF